MKLTEEAIAARIAAAPEVEPDEWDARMLKAADRDALDPDNDVMPYSEYVDARDYSGQIRLRIPKALHKALAMEAKENGVSLNQYMVYKLSRA